MTTDEIKKLAENEDDVSDLTDKTISWGLSIPMCKKDRQKIFDNIYVKIGLVDDVDSTIADYVYNTV